MPAKIVIQNVFSRIYGSVPPEVVELLNKELSYRVQDYEHVIEGMKKGFNSSGWDGIVRLYWEREGHRFYTGMMSSVLSILDESKFDYELDDRREIPPKNLQDMKLILPPGKFERPYQNVVVASMIKAGRGILQAATGSGKCLGKGTSVLMFDGTTKLVEQIVAGDLLMGPDSEPRFVKSTVSGRGLLYNVNQKNGDSFVCNDEHILCLQRTESISKKWKHKDIEITANDFYAANNDTKHIYKGYKVGVNFQKKEIPLDPYWIGLWLGEENGNLPEMTTGKNENELKNVLDGLGILSNKHIPISYKANDRKTRMLVLAGLIDSDGSFASHGTVEFVNSNKKLVEDVCWLARSLGFRASIKSVGYTGISYGVLIGGRISEIPILLKRKQAGNKTKHSALRYGITVSPIGIGDYYGFEIDKDGRFLLGDFTVTHNTFMGTKIIGTIKSGPFIFFVPSKDILDQAYDCLKDCLTVPIGRVGDGVCEVHDINVVMVQSAILALKRHDPKFKVADYKFDDEDDWDNSSLDEDKYKAVDALIRNAKGVIFDEVHHAASRTAQTIMEACSGAYWRFGCSATPFREDGAEKMIQALFGKVVQKISASWLIRNNYLVKPFIFNVRMIGMHGYWKSYPEVYKHYIVENDELNQLVARLTNRMKELGVPTLILVQRYPHGDAIKKMLPGAPFIKGNMPRTKRRGAITSLRDGTLQCAIATTLADEGLDVERLGCVMVAGGGKSITRVYQRVGRALRKFAGKERAIVFLFHHDAKFLNAHGNRVVSILKKEPEFVVINTTENRVMDDLNDLMCPGSVGIFG